MGVFFSWILCNPTLALVCLFSAAPKEERRHTPEVILARRSLCRASFLSEKTWSSLWLNEVPSYQSDRVYRDRTALIPRKSKASSVTRSLGPIRAMWPMCHEITVRHDIVYHNIYFESLGLTIFGADISYLQMHRTRGSTFHHPQLWERCQPWPFKVP